MHSFRVMHPTVRQTETLLQYLAEPMGRTEKCSSVQQFASYWMNINRQQTAGDAIQYRTINQSINLHDALILILTARWPPTCCCNGFNLPLSGRGFDSRPPRSSQVTTSGNLFTHIRSIIWYQTHGSHVLRLGR